MRISTVVALLGVTAATAHSAGAQGIGGKWSIVWDSDITMDHDTAIVKKRSTGTLELTVKGDSVTAVWNAGAGQGTQLRGTFDGKALRMTTGTNERVIKRDGEDIKMPVRWDMNGALAGPEVVGLAVHLHLGPTAPAGVGRRYVRSKERRVTPPGAAYGADAFRRRDVDHQRDDQVRRPATATTGRATSAARLCTRRRLSEEK